MRWNEKEKAWKLTDADMKLMLKCRMPLPEVLHPRGSGGKIPPLWSILSYAMLQAPQASGSIWRSYRQVLEIAADTRQYYYFYWIPKSGDGLRELAVPNRALRLHQKFIFNTILRELPVSDCAFAYRKGRSAAQCAAPHTGRDILIHADIQNFFGSITEDMVFATLRQETGYPNALCRLLARLCCLDGHLPQGACTSPILSNLVFRNCDEQLMKLAQSRNMCFTRYSDDLYFSAEGAVSVASVLREISQILRKNGFRMNPEKLSIRRQNSRQTVLGLTVNDHLQVTRDYRRSLLREIYYLERFGENCTGALAEGNYEKYVQRLKGKLAYALQINPEDTKLHNAKRTLLKLLEQQG